MTNIVAIVPLYKSPELLDTLINSIIVVADEIKKLQIKFLFINDSPDFEPLNSKLIDIFPRVSSRIDAQLIINDENLGFVKTVNKGIKFALELNADVLLLNSDIILTLGSISEICAVAKLDPMISVVSPRSNNATICNSPYQDTFRLLDYNKSLAAHSALKHYLPRTTYVPTAVGFCLYINKNMLLEFGNFDEIYEGGYNEENDFIMRCNRFGYRAVLANKAFVYHIGSISFSKSEVKKEPREEKNRKVLVSRYPEYIPSVHRYFNGIDFEAQSKLSGFIPDDKGKLKFLFDCYNIGPYHNGTFELAIKVIKHYVQAFHSKYTFYVACSHDALTFHSMDKIAGLNYCWDEERKIAPFAVAVRLAQPFALETIFNISNIANVTGFLILDTIAVDCQNLNTNDLESLFSKMYQGTSVVGYISEFSKQQAHSRFQIPTDCIEFASLCSTDPADYIDVRTDSTSQDKRKHVLLVGNSFSHKFVSETLEIIKSKKDFPNIVVMGVKMPDQERVTSYASGDLKQELVDALYSQASVVLFPSHYEGFGFPIMHALARKVPVIARSIPVYHEIRSKCSAYKNIYLFENTVEMVEMARRPIEWLEESPNKNHNWYNFVEQMEDAISKAVKATTYSKTVGRILFSKSLGHEIDKFSLAKETMIRKEEHINDGEDIQLRVKTSQYGLTPNYSVLLDGIDPNVKFVSIKRPLDILKMRASALQLLDASLKIKIGERILFSVKRQSTDADELYNNYIFSLVRSLCKNAGVRLEKAIVYKNNILLCANKELTWHRECVDQKDENTFIEEVYQLAFSRRPDDEALVWLNKLKKGESKIDIAKKIFSSAERVFLITRGVSTE